MMHRRPGDVRLREGDGLFTEKLARGLDLSFLDQYSARARRRPLIYRRSLARANVVHFRTFLIHISFDKK